MTIDCITYEHMTACRELVSPEGYEAFLEEIGQIVTSYQFTPAELRKQVADTSNADRQAKALLCLAGLEAPFAVDESRFAAQVLHANTNTRLLAAAAFFLVTSRDLSISYLESLFLSSSYFLRPAISVENEEPHSTLSREARYLFIKALGFRRHPDFTHLLYQIFVRQYHFFSQAHVADLIENAGEHLDEEEVIYYSRSISVDALGDYIGVSGDDRYSGTSNCPGCRFFPCKITDYYAGGIQDCSLWNTTDPSTAGDIIDRRTWGNVQSDQTAGTTDGGTVKRTWLEARRSLAKRQYQQAIPLLCRTLLLAEQQAQDSSMTPLAWLYLAHCFEDESAPLLPFIALREASEQAGLIPEEKIGERQKLQRFDARPETILGQDVNAWQQELRAIDYKKQEKWASALGCYLKANIVEEGKHGGGWFEIGECFEKLGRLHLAELFMHQGVVRATELSLRRKFLEAEQRVHRLIGQA